SHHLCGLHCDMEFWLFSALDQYRRNSVQAIQPGLDFICREFPEIRLRNLFGRQAVADDWETGKIEAAGLYLNRRGQGPLDTRHRSVDVLEGFDHVHAPVEEEIDGRRTSACHGPNLTQTRDTVNRLLNRARYRDFHLLDRHDAVFYTNDDARKVCR